MHTTGTHTNAHFVYLFIRFFFVRLYSSFKAKLYDRFDVCLFCCIFRLLLLCFFSLCTISIASFSHIFETDYFFSTSLDVFLCVSVPLRCSESVGERERTFVFCRQRCVCCCFILSCYSAEAFIVCVVFFFLLVAEIFISNSFSVLVSACTNRSIHVKFVAETHNTSSSLPCALEIVITVVSESSVCAVVSYVVLFVFIISKTPNYQLDLNKSREKKTRENPYRKYPVIDDDDETTAKEENAENS